MPLLCENVFTRRTMLGPIAAPGGSVFALLVLIVLALIGDYPLLIMLIVSSTPPLWEASPKKYLIVSFLSLVCFFTCLHCVSCLELKFGVSIVALYQLWRERNSQKVAPAKPKVANQYHRYKNPGRSNKKRDFQFTSMHDTYPALKIADKITIYSVLPKSNATQLL